MKKPCGSVWLHMAFDVNLLVRQPNRFLEDLHKINQLKDSPYQSDLEVNRPKPKQPLNPSKVRKFVFALRTTCLIPELFSYSSGDRGVLGFCG